ncbi:MAG: amidase [Acidimicrobiaceae bacterium]|nr:amidase [Acidimicrobiaceae bacterium]MCO5329646.1 amidase [Ilumatobacteraceae bacterium]
MTVRATVAEALARLDAAAALGAVVARDDAAALSQADALDGLPEDARRLPLFGRAITVKDWIDVAGLPCEGESAERTGRVPSRDATAVARLRAAGAVVVAKTQPGADHPIHGRCHHPVDPLRTPGASSSGEAALVGGGASQLGLGSDSGGSIRLPAAWCGAVGVKPSAGLVPTTGHFPRVGDRVDGRTVIGPLTRSVADAVTALRVIAGPDGVDAGCMPVPLGDPALVHIDGLRVAVFLGDGGWAPAPSTCAAVERAASLLADAGALVMAEALPAHLAESFDITTRYWRRAGHDPSLTGVDVDLQLRDWDRFAGRMLRASAAFDVVVGPAVADVAPHHRPLDGEDFVFTLPWSLAGWAAVSLPAGVDAATGLPLAVQIAAPRWHDHVALAVAAHLEPQVGGEVRQDRH